MASDHARLPPCNTRWGRAPSILGPEDPLERRTRTAVAVASETDARGAALERVVFLECRVDQLGAELELRAAELARAQEEAARAAARESERTREVSRLEAALSAQRAEAAELARRLGSAEAARAGAGAEVAARAAAEAALAQAREQLDEQRQQVAAREREIQALRQRTVALEHAAERVFQRLIDWQSGAPGASPDLAEFIAELRSEIVALQRTRDAAWSREEALREALQRAGVDAEAVAPRQEEPVPAVPALPLRPALHDVESALDGLPTEAERRLARQLVRELDAGAAAARARAAARLVTLAGKRAAPALAASAAACADRPARAALVEALGRTGEPHALEACRRFLEDAAAEVRGAAVDACTRLAEGDERDALIRGGAADADPRVRRRAVLAAAAVRGVDPGPLVAPLCSDPDRQVRRVACSALATTRDPSAASALVSALADPDAGVRAAAVSAAGRLLGEDVAGIVALQPMARDRQIARLRSSLEYRPLPAPAGGPALSAPHAPTPPAASAPLAVAPAGALAVDAPAADAAPTTPVGDQAVEARAADPAPAAAPDDEAVLAVVRAALRGASEAEIASEVGCTAGELAAALDRLVHHGLLVRRGRKLYLP